jgi:hypothetical protein
VGVDYLWFDELEAADPDRPVRDAVLHIAVSVTHQVWPGVG